MSTGHKKRLIIKPELQSTSKTPQNHLTNSTSLISIVNPNLKQSTTSSKHETTIKDKKKYRYSTPGKLFRNSSEKSTPAQSPHRHRASVDLYETCDNFAASNMSFRNKSTYQTSQSSNDSDYPMSRTTFSLQNKLSESFYFKPKESIDIDKLEFYLSQKSKDGHTIHQLNAYKEVFEIVIENDKVYGNVLRRIKKAYEDSQNEIYEIALGKCSEERKEMVEKIAKLTKENSRFKKKLDKCQRELEKVKEEWLEYSKTSFEQINNEKNQCKGLIEEKNALVEKLNYIKHVLLNSNIREQKYKKLLSLLKERGIPVQEIYNQEIKKCSHNELAPKKEEFLNQKVKKPEIPPLKMPRIDSSQSLEYSSDEENENVGLDTENLQSPEGLQIFQEFLEISEEL